MSILGKLLTSLLIGWFVLILVMALTGCASVQPHTVYQPVPTAVPVSCVPADTQQAPKVLTPADLAKLDGPDRFVQAVAAYLALYGWSLSAAPVIAGCR